jgi:hypothetical protein
MMNHCNSTLAQKSVKCSLEFERMISTGMEVRLKAASVMRLLRQIRRQESD